MKLDAARRLGEVRRLCVLIDETIPRWVLVLFVASLGALYLVEMDRRLYGMGKYTLIYVCLNCVIAASTAAFIAARLYKAYRR